MKKYILNLGLIAFICLPILSCSDDDDATVTTNATTATLSFTRVGADDAILEDGGTVEFQVSLDSALPFDAIGTLEVSSSDGSLESTPGVSEVTFTPQFTLAAGETSTTIQLTFNDDTVTDTEVYTVALSNFKPVGNNFPDFTFIMPEVGLTFENSTIEVFDTLPTIITTTAGDVTINFTWTGGADLDCRIRDAGLTTIDTGYTGTPGETVELLETQPDGTYIVSIRPWSNLEPSIDFTFDFVYPDGNMAFSSTLVDATGSWSQEDNFLEIIKATSGSDVTYTITQLF